MHALTRIRATLLVTLATALLVPAHAWAWTVDTAQRTDDEIRAKWESAAPTYNGAPYAIAPKLIAPYEEGELNAAFLNDGMRMLNYGRFLAGLPDDVVNANAYSVGDQMACVLEYKNGALDHNPPQPADMDGNFYATAIWASSKSNLAWGTDDLEDAVRLYLDDSDSSNIAHVGHRRWILNPPMRSSGMGFVDGFSALYAFDHGRSEVVSYTAVTWPAAGPFPTEFFRAGTAWSMTLNPSLFSVNRAQLTVTLRRLADNATWTFTSADAPGTPGAEELLNYCTSGYGVPSCVIFRPPTSVTYAPGDEFEVSIVGGLYDKASSQPISLAYRTRFMSLDPQVVRAPSSISFAPPSAVVFGSSVSLKAWVTSAENPLSGRTVVFERSLDGGASWQSIAETQTAENGDARAIWTVRSSRASTLVRARHLGDETIADAQRPAGVTVRPYLTLSAPSSARRGRAFSAVGYTRPRHKLGSSAGSVRYYCRVNGAWAYRGAVPAKVVYNSATASKVRGIVTLGAGTWKLKFVHPGDATHVGASVSRTLVVR